MTHISINKKIGKLKKYKQFPSLKPKGIWYSYYNRWLKFLCDDSGLIDPGDKLYIYKIKISSSAKILTIRTEKEYYKIFGKRANLRNNIWIKYVKKYDGIYFDYTPPSWFHNHIDVKSGCIWNPNIVTLKFKGVKKIK